MRPDLRIGPCRPIALLLGEQVEEAQTVGQVEDLLSHEEDHLVQTKFGGSVQRGTYVTVLSTMHVGELACPVLRIFGGRLRCRDRLWRALGRLARTGRRGCAM